MVGRIRWARLGAALVVGVAVAAPPAPAGADPSIKYQTVVTDEFPPEGGIRFVLSPELPDLVPPGNYKVAFFNGSVAPHVLVVVSLPDDVDTVEEFLPLLRAVEVEGEPPPEDSEFIGAVFSKQGQNHQKQFDLTEAGQYGWFCPIPSPTGVPHFDEGFVGVFEVG